jgi:hypothetical protein
MLFAAIRHFETSSRNDQKYCIKVYELMKCLFSAGRFSGPLAVKTPAFSTIFPEVREITVTR